MGSAAWRRDCRALLLDRRAREGLRRRIYTSEEIDAFAAYCPENERCYYIPFGVLAARTQVHLRLAPSRNNQRLGIHWAENFEFAATLGAHDGAIAQLGERRRGTPKVAGSSPAGSIPEPAADGVFSSDAGRLFGE